MRKGNNIRKRIDGRWEARYEKDRDENGRIIYGYCYGNTKEEAEEKKLNAISRKLLPKQMNLIILGAGFLAKEVKELAKELKIFKKIDFLEDIKTNPKSIGKCSNVDFMIDEYPMGIPSVSDKTLRIKWFRKLVNAGFLIPVLIHPSANVSVDATIDAGTIICAGATIAPGAQIGKGCIIYSGAIINRNAVVPDFSFIDCGEIVIAKKVEMETN